MWVWLAAAIVSEVLASLSLRASEGMTRLAPALAVVVGYSFAFFSLSRAMSAGLSLGHAYAVWAGIGVALIAVLSTAVFGDRFSLVQIGGIALIVTGVVVMELGRVHN